MSGYRARGALATLALATVVLVAVVVAGTVSMAPLGDNWTANIAGPEDRDSFEIVDGVVVPRSPGEAASPEVVKGGDGNVEVAGDLDPAEAAGTTPDTPDVVPPGPIFGPLDPVGPPVVDPTEPPVVGPNQPPVVDPTEPPVVDPTEPPVVVPTDPSPPDYRPGAGGPRPVIGRPDGHPFFKPKPKPAKHGKPAIRPGKQKNGPPVVVVLRPRGPKWRPPAPARQRPPHDAGKWSRAQPHPRQHAAPAKKPRRNQSVAKAPAKQRAIVPSRPKVRKGGNGHHGNSVISPPSRGKSGKHGRGPQRGHRGKGKRGRR